MYENKDLKCDLCNKEIETQQQIYKCKPIVENANTPRFQYDDLFTNNMDKLINVARITLIDTRNLLREPVI